MAAESTTDARRAAARGQALKSSLTMRRLLGNGMEYADAQDLYELVDAGVAWERAAARLGERDAALAEQALVAGHRQTARSWFLHAAACFRFGLVHLPDGDPFKHEMVRRLIACFGAAGDLHHPRFEHVEIPWGDGALCGWLIAPAGPRPWPAVIQLGGAEGWCEEYEISARYLRTRGVASLLVDAPGQGATRLRYGLHLDRHIAAAFSAMLDWLLHRADCSGRVGIWGHSLGASLGIRAAAEDQRFAAVCANGAGARAAELVARQPLFATRLTRLTGARRLSEAVALLDGLLLDAGRLGRLRCPLHVVHGRPDPYVPIENARRIWRLAGSADKRMTEFADGDHCIFNRPHEKHALVADWFAERLNC